MRGLGWESWNNDMVVVFVVEAEANLKERQYIFMASGLLTERRQRQVGATGE